MTIIENEDNNEVTEVSNVEVLTENIEDSSDIEINVNIATNTDIASDVNVEDESGLDNELNSPAGIEDTNISDVQITENYEVEKAGVEGEEIMNSNSEVGTVSDPETESEKLNSSTDAEGSLSKASKLILVTIVNDGEEKELQVEILNSSIKKPFLGGFRHKLTGAEYVNASCQTYPKKILDNGIEKFNRDTQTVITRSQVQQTHNNTSTQMTKPGCYVSDIHDKVIIPGKYITAAEKEEVILEKVIILQSYWRRWLATQYVHKLKKDKEMRIQWEIAQAEQIAAERAERLRLEFERRMNPKTKADFDLLFAALEGWRKEEVEKINAKHSGAERKAALVGLLDQEAYLIQCIERHRLNADKTNMEENIRKFLNKAAQPKYWRSFNGRRTEMDTQFTLRAQELRDLYNSLQMNYLNKDERLDVLLTLKHTVKEHECKLTHDLVELIDREADLISRGIKSTNLQGLRQRITTLFLQYCKTPEFNPEVGRLLKVPQDASKLRKDIYFCPSCNSYLPSSEFPLASNSRIVGRCKKCSVLDNNARLRNDFTKVRCILQHLRRTEEAYNDNSKIAFGIQDADLQYLIENIWNSQSALSGLDELYDLVFVRWNKHEQWSPWNCVLLTKEEASAHMKLENYAEAYGRIFIGKVHQKHVLAQKYFNKLNKIAVGTITAADHVNIKQKVRTQQVF